MNDYSHDALWRRAVDESRHPEDDGAQLAFAFVVGFLLGIVAAALVQSGLYVPRRRPTSEAAGPAEPPPEVPPSSSGDASS